MENDAWDIEDVACSVANMKAGLSTIFGSEKGSGRKRGRLDAGRDLCAQLQLDDVSWPTRRYGIA